MGNDISTSSKFTSVQNNLINDIKNTLNTDTETFKPKNQNGGIIWNVNDKFDTREGFRGVVIEKRMEPHFLNQRLYRVNVNNKLESMWPESNMMEISKEKK